MHPETKHLAEDVVRICKEQEVSAEFIVAVMRWERRPDLHNWFGWSLGDKLLRFDSDLQCLETVIPKIKKNYLTEGGLYYNGATVEGVSKYYNDTDFWRDTISAEVERMMENEMVDKQDERKDGQRHGIPSERYYGIYPNHFACDFGRNWQIVKPFIFR